MSNIMNYKERVSTTKISRSYTDSHCLWTYNSCPSLREAKEGDLAQPYSNPQLIFD